MTPEDNNLNNISKENCTPIEGPDGIHYLYNGVEVPEFFEPFELGGNDEDEDTNEEEPGDDSEETEGDEEGEQDEDDGEENPDKQKKYKDNSSEENPEPNELEETGGAEGAEAAEEAEVAATEAAEAAEAAEVAATTEVVAAETAVAEEGVVATAGVWGPAALAVFIIGVIILIFVFFFIGARKDTAFGDTPNAGCTAGDKCSIADMLYMNQFTTDTTSCPVVGPTKWDFGTTEGCGITSQAMIESFFLKKRVTPDDIFYGRNGHPQQGIYMQLGVLNEQIKSTGVQYKEMSVLNLGDAENALKKAEEGIKAGYPSVSHTYPPFAHTYHIMVIVGFTPEGNVIINDPNCGPTAAAAYEKSTPGTGKNRIADRNKFKAAMVNRMLKYPVWK